MRAHPLRESFSVEVATRDGNKRSLCLIDSGTQLEAIQNEEDLQGRVPDPFVPVKERMVLNQGESKSSGFGRRVGVEIPPSEGHARLRNRRLQSSQISDPRASARLCKEPTMEFQYLP